LLMPQLHAMLKEDESRQTLAVEAAHYSGVAGLVDGEHLDGRPQLPLQGREGGKSGCGGRLANPHGYWGQ